MHLGGALQLLVCISVALLLAAMTSALPEEVMAALAPDRPKPEGVDDHSRSLQMKNILTRVYKKRVIRLPFKGLEITLLPWECYNQTNCQTEPVCGTTGVTTSCSLRCYACNSCLQPKIIKKRLSSGKTSVTHKRYIRTHRCGFCHSRAECSLASGGKPDCPRPAPCLLKD